MWNTKSRREHIPETPAHARLPQADETGYDSGALDSLATLSDMELVALCKKELPETTRSYEILARRYMQRIYSVVYRIVKDEQEAEDVVQEVFFRLYRGINAFECRSAFSTWLYRIATNCALDALEDMQREAHARLTMHTSTVGAIDATLQAELREQVYLSIKRLDVEQAGLLLLRDFDGLSYDEISRHLNLGLSAVKMRIHRARRAFRAIFAQEDQSRSDDQLQIIR